MPPVEPARTMPPIGAHDHADPKNARRCASIGKPHAAIIGRFFKLILVFAVFTASVAGIIALKSSIWIVPFIR